MIENIIMTIDFTDVILLLLTVIFLPIVWQLTTKYKSIAIEKIGKDVAFLAVQFVEQTMKSETGQRKKHEAINLIDSRLTELGIILDEEKIILLLEAAVYEAINKIKETE